MGKLIGEHAELPVRVQLILELRDFRKMEIAHLHRRDDHFERLFPGGAPFLHKESAAARNTGWRVVMLPEARFPSNRTHGKVVSQFENRLNSSGV
jgi:hypothetical protein